MPSVAEAGLSVGAIRGCQAKLNVGHTEVSETDGAILQVEYDDSGFEAALARTHPQVCAFEIVLDGVAVDMKNVTGSISVTRSYDQRLQTWNFSLILTTPTGPLGSPFTCIGPSTGKRKVTINGIYKILSGALAGSIVRIPLITDGIADNSSREASGEGTYTETISGVCRGGRYDQEVVTIVLPPGHGFPRGRVLRMLAERAGETQINVEDGNPMYKEVQVVDGDWLSVGAEQQEVENRRPLWDPSGYFINPKIGRPRSDEPVFVTLDERDWLDLAIVSVSHKADVLTDVTLTGTEQMLDGPCGLETDPPQETRTFADYARATPTYLYSGGSFSANALNPDAVAEERLVQLVRYTQTLRCGTVVYDRTETWGWKNPLAIRQVYDTGTSAWVHEAGIYTNDNNPDSRDVAYQYGIEQWTITNLTESWHYYHQKDYVHPFETVSDPERAWLQGLYGYTELSPGGEWSGDFVGFYLGTITRVSGYHFVRKALYTRSVAARPYDPWDSLEPDDNVGIIGNDGHAVPSNLPFDQTTLTHIYPAGNGTAYGEAFMPISETVLTVHADALGYKEREVVTEYGWGHVPVGSEAKYHYGDGSDSSEAEDSWRGIKTTETLFISTGESQHKTVRNDYLFGQLVGGEQVSGIAGDRPAVNRIDAPEWPEDLYESDEEFASLAGAARRSHTRQIKVRVTAPGLLTCHTNGILKTEVPLAENESEMLAIGRFLIDESLAADVQGTVLFNAYLREGMVIRAKHRPIGLDHDVRIQSVTHSGTQQDGSPMTTAIVAKLYGGVSVVEEEL